MKCGYFKKFGCLCEGAYVRIEKEAIRGNKPVISGKIDQIDYEQNHLYMEPPVIRTMEGFESQLIENSSVGIRGEDIRGISSISEKIFLESCKILKENGKE